MNLREIGSMIRHYRMASQVALRPMARDMRLSHSYLAKIERGEVKASPETLTTIMECIGVPKEQIDKLVPRCPHCGHFERTEK